MWWGRVVIGSITVCQTIGTVSSPVVSTIFLGVSTRSIGIDPSSCFSFAWGSLEISVLFPIYWVIGRLFLFVS